MSLRVVENTPYYETEAWPGSFSVSNVSTATDDVISKHIKSIGITDGDLYSEDGIWVVDFAIIRNQLEIWKRLLPRVKLFYAVKTNATFELLKYLAEYLDLKIGFDCASHKELADILALSISPEDIIYANPCKAPSHIRYASKMNVKKMTFDNIAELHKIKACFPDAECVLRFKVSAATSCDEAPEGAMYELSKKYGVTIDYSRELLLHAKELGLNVTGLAFHVGSGQRNVKAYAHHIAEARRIWDIASEVGYNFTILDIGGGFMYANFERAANVVNTALDEEFGDLLEQGEIEIIAEPGRYVSAPAFTLATSVIAVREGKEQPSGRRMVYLADGMYSNINAALWPGELTYPTVVKGNRMEGLKSTLPVSSASSDSGIEIDESGLDSVTREGSVGTPIKGDLQEYSVWGPTCDCMDVVMESAFLPGGLEVGDWFVFKDLGAYSTSMRTTFNGFSTSHRMFFVNMNK